MINKTNSQTAIRDFLNGYAGNAYYITIYIKDDNTTIYTNIAEIKDIYKSFKVKAWTVNNNGFIFNV